MGMEGGLRGTRRQCTRRFLPNEPSNTKFSLPSYELFRHEPTDRAWARKLTSWPKKLRTGDGNGRGLTRKTKATHRTFPAWRAFDHKIITASFSVTSTSTRHPTRGAQRGRSNAARLQEATQNSSSRVRQVLVIVVVLVRLLYQSRIRGQVLDFNPLAQPFILSGKFCYC